MIVDTSGRLSNNFEATENLQEMKATIRAAFPTAPHETLLVVDGSLGRSAVDQADVWRKSVGITSLAVTKMDGTARGGFIVPVVNELNLPVKLIGVGEKLDDLRDFQPEVFVDALLGNSEDKKEALRQRAGQIIRTRAGIATSASITSAKKDDAVSRLKASFDSNKRADKENSGLSKVGSKKSNSKAAAKNAKKKKKK